MAVYRVFACKKCNKLFKSMVYADVCPYCVAKDEEVFYEVKKYIRKNRNSKIVDVCNEFGVEEQQILKWVRQERLYFSKDSGVVFYCIKCNAPIQTGKYCQSCKTKLVSNVQSGSIRHDDEKPSGINGGGMHYKKKK